MGNNSSDKKSRRWFLTGGFSVPKSPKEKVKMLTADGKLVEVDKSVLEAVNNRKKISNKELLDWMNNPSKAE
jgi:hypothetical protein